MRITQIILLVFLITLINCSKAQDGTCFPKEENNDYIEVDENEKPEETIRDKYIVFFLTNTSVKQANTSNFGKDADRNYSFVKELPFLFGDVKKRQKIKYAFGLSGPMLLTQSIEEMQEEIDYAFNIAIKENVPVYFQLDDCNNYTAQFGNDAAVKFYENPDWSEWIAFPKSDETWGGETNGRLPYYWFNWGNWMHTEAFPSFQSDGFRNFVLRQLKQGVIKPLKKWVDSLDNKGLGYLFAGLSVGWETHIPDYSKSNTILNININNLPVNSLAGDRMKTWEAGKYGYNSLSKLGYNEYDIDALYQVIHDYIELLAKEVNESGIPKEKIYSHIVGFTTSDRDLETTFAPPVWTAVNSFSTPGFTMSPVTCPYNLDTLIADIQNADRTIKNFGCVEGYSVGIDDNFSQANDYFKSMFDYGASLVSVFGWGIEPESSMFSVSHSSDNPFVKAAKKWITTQ